MSIWKSFILDSPENKIRKVVSGRGGCCHTQPKRDVVRFLIFLSVHALLLIHSSSFNAVRPLTRWMSIDSGVSRYTLYDWNLVFVHARFPIFSESESVRDPPLFSLSAR